MKLKKICVISFLLLLMFLIIFGLNFYFLNRLNEQISLKKDKSNNRSHSVPAKSKTSSSSIKTDSNSKTNDNIELQLNEKYKTLKPVYLNRNPRFYAMRPKILQNFLPTKYNQEDDIWRTANSWTESNEVFPDIDPTIGKLIYALQTEPIISARNSPRGTQLKLVFNLTGSHTVIFKPRWYSRNHIVRGPVYAGKDRHTAEIFGFYLGAILGFRSTAIVVGRRINLKSIYELGDAELRSTMTIEKNSTKYCVYGKCYYCRPSEKICGDNSQNMEIEGVVMHLIPGDFVKNRSPWQRTYNSKKAEWEENINYCESLKLVLPETRLLDLIDTAIFDFIIQNGDRHHYETRNQRILLLDNGKGFGNPNVDFLDILAPLYQCCIIRKTTWTRLLIFSGGSITEIIEELTRNDILHPILADQHYEAVERRLLFVFSTVEICIDKFGKNNVFR